MRTLVEQDIGGHAIKCPPNVEVQQCALELGARQSPRPLTVMGLEVGAQRLEAPLVDPAGSSMTTWCSCQAVHLPKPDCGPCRWQRPALRLGFLRTAPCLRGVRNQAQGWEIGMWTLLGQEGSGLSLPQGDALGGSPGLMNSAGGRG